jgi:hypothetical protein
MATCFLQRKGLACVISAFPVVACSSSSATSDAREAGGAGIQQDGGSATAGADGAGTAGDDAASTGATAYVSLGPIGGPSDASSCPASWLKVGTYGFPVTDGATDRSTGARVRVSCSVVATGDAGNTFRLQATIRSTSDGGSQALTIAGQISSGSNPRGISVTIDGGGGTYTDGNCGAIYSQLGEGVAPGFWWALLECSGLKDAAQNRTCNASGQIELQNCGSS